MQRWVSSVITGVAAAVVVASSAGGASGAPAAPERPAGAASGGWCTDSGGTTHAAPCILSAQVTHSDGTVVGVAQNSSVWDVELEVVPPAQDQGATDLLWSVEPVAGGDLDAGDTWRIAVDPGSVIPRTTFTRGDSVVVQRSGSSVQITGRPTRTGIDNCDQSALPWTCPARSADDRIAFQGDIDDFGQWDAATRDDFTGFDVYTNVEATDAPPQVLGDGTPESPYQLLVDLANSFEFADGAVAKGFYHLILPKAYLASLGVDDPSTMTSQAVSGAASSGTVTVDTSGTAMVVDVRNVVFPNPNAPVGMRADTGSRRFNSQRSLRVRRGSVLPGTPTHVRAVRLSATHGGVHFSAVRSHGSRIRSYQAICSAPHQRTRSGVGPAKGVLVTGLTKNVAYRCSVRARTRVGYGHRSGAAKLRAKPAKRS